MIEFEGEIEESLKFVLWFGDILVCLGDGDEK